MGSSVVCGMPPVATPTLIDYKKEESKRGSGGQCPPAGQGRALPPKRSDTQGSSQVRTSRRLAKRWHCEDTVPVDLSAATTCLAVDGQQEDSFSGDTETQKRKRGFGGPRPPTGTGRARPLSSPPPRDLALAAPSQTGSTPTLLPRPNWARARSPRPHTRPGGYTAHSGTRRVCRVRCIPSGRAFRADAARSPLGRVGLRGLWGWGTSETGRRS